MQNFLYSIGRWVIDSYNRTRYTILKKDGVLASICRRLVILFYPIINNKFILNSRVFNLNNKEKLSFYEQLDGATGNVRKDLILSYMFYHILPWEYELYNFAKQKHEQRLMWLSDTDRFMCCRLAMGINTFKCLTDKAIFYSMAKDFFKRPVYVFDKSTRKEHMEAFVSKADKLFVKPLDGSLGKGAFIIESNDYVSLYDKLTRSGKCWMLEGVINQVDDMSMWNKTSVNTVRIPSFKVNGEIHILQPFFRTGRKGQIVDNAGAGGILCVIDEVSGVIKTDGFDEHNNQYEYHPDCGLKYKDWQIPHWNELRGLVRKVHLALPDDFRYIGFDFALTPSGWDLIEGNWGQMVGQIAEQRGIKREFESYLGI